MIEDMSREHKIDKLIYSSVFEHIDEPKEQFVLPPPNNNDIVSLFGLTNRTAVLLDLIERTPLTIYEIDIPRIAKKYSNAPSTKLSLKNSLTVKRNALDHFVEQGFVHVLKNFRSKRGRPQYIYHLDVNNPIIQGIISLIRLEVKKDV